MPDPVVYLMVWVLALDDFGKEPRLQCRQQRGHDMGMAKISCSVLQEHLERMREVIQCFQAYRHALFPCRLWNQLRVAQLSWLESAYK